MSVQITPEYARQITLMRLKAMGRKPLVLDGTNYKGKSKAKQQRLLREYTKIIAESTLCLPPMYLITFVIGAVQASPEAWVPCSYICLSREDHQMISYKDAGIILKAYDMRPLPGDGCWWTRIGDTPVLNIIQGIDLHDAQG